MKHKKAIIIIIVVLVLFLGLVGLRAKQRKDENEAMKKMKPPLTAVSVIVPKKGKIAEAFSTTGTLVAQSEVQVIPKASGKLISLNVDEGNVVSAGQILGEIEHNELDAQILQTRAQSRAANANLELLLNGPMKEQIEQAGASVKLAQANLSQTKINLQKAQSDLNRYENLFSQGLITPQQLEANKTQVDTLKKQVNAGEQQVISAQSGLKLLKDGTRKEQLEGGRAQTEQVNATIQLLQAQLANYSIVSPINGVVTKRNFDPGSLVGSTTPVLTISKSTQPELEMNIPEREILYLHLGENVLIESSAFPGKTITVKIKEISPVVDTQTRLIKVKATVNSNLPFKIGMLLDCKILLQEKENSLILPLEAIINSDDGDLVYVTVNNKVEARKVKLGIETPVEVEIESGLKSDEQVIVKGNTFVRPGDQVQIQKTVSSIGGE